MTDRVDNFNRADSSTSLGAPSDGGGGYTTNGTWGIVSSRAYCVVSAAQSVAYLDASITDADVQVTLATMSADVGLVARVVDSNNYFLSAVTSGTGFRLYKRVAGSFTQLGTTYSGTPANGDVLKLTVNGTSLTVYVNGTSRITATDSSHASATKFGLRAHNDSSSRFDDFSVTGLGGGTSVSPGAGSVTVSGQAPTVAQSANQSLTAGAGSVTLQGFAPTVAQSQSVDPGAGPLTISGFAPAVSQSASGAVAPDAGAVTLTGYAPSIAQPQTAAPGAGALTFTGYAPDVQQASGVLPGAGSITITGQAPTVAQTAAQSVAPGTGPLSITGYAPDIAQSGQPQAPSGGVIFGRPPWAKRYVVQHGRRVLVFGTEAAALEAQAAIDKARAIRATATAAPSNRARRRVEKTARGVIAGALASIPPVDSFTADQLQALANTYASSDTLAELQRLRDFEQMARMWEDLRAEEDDIAAFMELM